MVHKINQIAIDKRKIAARASTLHQKAHRAQGEEFSCKDRARRALILKRESRNTGCRQRTKPAEIRSIRPARSPACLPGVR